MGCVAGCQGNAPRRAKQETWLLKEPRPRYEGLRNPCEAYLHIAAVSLPEYCSKADRGRPLRRGCRPEQRATSIPSASSTSSFHKSHASTSKSTGRCPVFLLLLPLCNYEQRTEQYPLGHHRTFLCLAISHPNRTLTSFILLSITTTDPLSGLRMASNDSLRHIYSRR